MEDASFSLGEKGLFLLQVLVPSLLLLVALNLVRQRRRAKAAMRDNSSVQASQVTECRSTNGTAPSIDQTAPSRVSIPRAPASADATAPPPVSKSEETGSVEATNSEAVASALALAQRVRDLGLHLGEVVVTGISFGLPNAETGRAVFDRNNLLALMRGDNFIGPLPASLLQAQLDRNVVQVSKDANGARVRKPISALEEVIQLASRIGEFDLAAEYSISPAVVETLDTTYALAVAAGLEALRNAKLIEPPPRVNTSLAADAGAKPVGWKLDRAHRDETGVIFAASFPALDSLIEELARAMTLRLQAVQANERSRWMSELREVLSRRREAVSSEEDASSAAATSLDAVSEWLEQQAGEGDAAACSSARGYEFNRKLLFKLLVMANTQLAEIVQAKGPNLHINAACAGTTAAIALGFDWLRTGRCRRVVVISADNPSSEHLLPWVGIGFLALGAASTKPCVEEAALPFDKRRNGMLLGAGAVGLVLETDIAAAAMGPERPPLSKVLAVRHANSAFHASAICVKHATEQLERLLREVETVHGLSKSQIASSLLYFSHETFTYARNGGCAGAEVTALRSAFGDDIRKILITNSKGLTGHAMGVCFEDVLSVAALSTGLAPPIANHRENDPVLGPLRLSEGGSHTCRFALHFAAGFGSQVTYILYEK
uniref:beta-ketoacyl-[acyl-carrier-protein] synthase I n=1 Tax=Haptolina brevifila TaxID=156173 RepID=A0A7S2ILQ0_9EUKA